ncbi:hypothetical protein PFISCL1PPCAC_22025, partial [Pristionchus fissidentatus]
ATTVIISSSSRSSGQSIFVNRYRMHFSTGDEGRHHYSLDPAATNVMSSSPPLSSIATTSSTSSIQHSMSINDHLSSCPLPPLSPHPACPTQSTTTAASHQSVMQWTSAPINYAQQNPSTSMLDGGYGSAGVQSGSAACQQQQLDQMIRMHSSSTSSSSPINNNIGDMSGLSDAHQLKNEPIDPSYPLSNLGHMGMPGFEMLSSPYASSARSHSEGSLVLPPQLRRSSRASVDGFSRCRHCPKKLSTPEQMEEHMVECKLDRVHQCTRCEKRFKARGGLQQHMRIHDEVKPFECTFCQKRFTQKSHIDQHLRIHTGLKPFSCRYCGRLFRQRSQQLGHENTHFNTANNRLMNLPLQMPPAECEPALNLSHQHSPHSGQSSPIPPVTVSSPYAPMPAPSDNIAALLGMHTGAPPQMIVPCTTFQPIDLINTTTH